MALPSVFWYRCSARASLCPVSLGRAKSLAACTVPRRNWWCSGWWQRCDICCSSCCFCWGYLLKRVGNFGNFWCGSTIWVWFYTSFSSITSYIAKLAIPNSGTERFLMSIFFLRHVFLQPQKLSINQRLCLAMFFSTRTRFDLPRQQPPGRQQLVRMRRLRSSRGPRGRWARLEGCFFLSGGSKHHRFDLGDGCFCQRLE